MRRTRSRQLQLSLNPQAAAMLPKEKAREVVDALAELLLEALRKGNKGNGDEGRDDDEREDHT